jgi:DNA-binding response OmpR family regulator
MSWEATGRTDKNRIPLIAIVDDEEDITTYLGLALEDAGYEVVTINESASALKTLRQQPPDLICLDLLMPHRTGASLYLEIQQDQHLEKVPVLILSGLNAKDELNEILQRESNAAPPADYLEKPVAIDPFLAKVAELLTQNGQSTPERAQS